MLWRKKGTAYFFAQQEVITSVKHSLTLVFKLKYGQSIRRILLHFESNSTYWTR